MARVLICGGSGSIGNELARFLDQQGHEVSMLSRSVKPNSEFEVYTWNPKLGKMDSRALEGCDFIVQLAGAGIADRTWTRKRKEEIIASRVQSTDLLFNRIRDLKIPLKGFISASAVGYYGQVTSEKIFSEDDPPANDFLGKTCFLWEQAAHQFESIGIRTVIFRIGIVLLKKGGALEKIVQPIRIGIGSSLGSGDQYFPWIHQNDLVQMFHRSIAETSMKGVYNAVGPEHATNRELTRTIATVLGKTIWLPPVPGPVLRLILGERAVLVLKGSRVSCERILQSGHHFEFSNLTAALKDLLDN